MADNATMEYASKYDLNEVDKRLSKEMQENRDHIVEHSKEIARLEAVYKSLEGLPLTITNLDKTITVIGSNLESMDRNLADVRRSVSEQEQAIKEIRSENTKQSADIEQIDNKSKIDILVLLKNNFWKILSALAIGYAIIDIIMKKGG